MKSTKGQATSKQRHLESKWCMQCYGQINRHSKEQWGDMSNCL